MRGLLGLLLACLLVPAASFTVSPTPARVVTARRSTVPACAADSPPPDLEEVTEKYGLEAGIFSALKRGGGSGGDGDDGAEKPGAMATAGDLLKRYGGAYLLTSTSLAAVSFGLCYTLISNGVDVGSLLERVGIEARAHAAASPRPRRRLASTARGCRLASLACGRLPCWPPM